MKKITLKARKTTPTSISTKKNDTNNDDTNNNNSNIERILIAITKQETKAEAITEDQEFNIL